MKTMKTTNKLTYSELIKIPSYLDRFKYLSLDGTVGADTFGFDRFINQEFYRSKEWKDIRDYVILRDNGCDLAVPGYDIYDKRNIRIHHMNPISLNDIRYRTDILMDPEYLITTTQRTHNAIHYGNEELLIGDPVERGKNDTCPWRK